MFSSNWQSPKKSLKWPWLLLVLFAFGIGLYTGIQWFFTLNEEGCLPLTEDIKPIRLQLNDNSNLRFIALGDTANYRPDEDNPTPRDIVQSIQRLCAQKPCDFVVFLGDNFYNHGINSSEDAHLEYFESVYRRLNMPMIGVLGNHDIRGPGQAFAQVVYGQKNTQWHMPNYRYQFDAGPASFTAINTNCNALAWWRLKDQPEKPKDSWNFLLGHHPIYGNGAHGDAIFFNRWLWQTFGETKFDAYFAGHNHNLQVSQKDKQGSLHVVSGAVYATEADRIGIEQQKTAAKTLFESAEHGFAIVEVNEKLLTITFYNDQANRLFRLETNKKGEVKIL